MKAYYPVFLDLMGKPVLVVGGGKVAEKKIVGLLEAGARVRVLAPEVTAKMRGWAKERKITWERRKAGGKRGPSPLTLALSHKGRGKVAVAIAATNDEKTNASISKLCDKMGILCNVVDQSGLSSFIAPSVGRKGGITLAVSTAGASPLMAGLVRRALEKRIGLPEIRLLRFLRALRPRVKSSLKSPAVRRRFYQRVVLGPIGALASAGKAREARTRALRLIAGAQRLS